MPDRGRSALVVPVPELDQPLEPWRSRFDPAAARHMPAHITILFPFVRRNRLSTADLDELGTLCAAVPTHAVTFRHCRRFEGTMWLAPEPDAEFVSLTRAVVDAWPQVPPYGGAHTEIIPHVTVAQGEGESFDRIERELASVLPVQATVREAALFVPEGGRWVPWRRFAFRPG
jgi:2'-5' RNA ligase